MRWDQGRAPCSPTARAWCAPRPQGLENRRWPRRLPHRGGVRPCPPGRRTTPRFQVNENRAKRSRQVDREGGLSHPSLPLDHGEDCHGAYSTASGPRAARTGRTGCSGCAARTATTVCAGATVRTGRTVSCRSMQFPSRPRTRARTPESAQCWGPCHQGESKLSGHSHTEKSMPPAWLAPGRSALPAAAGFQPGEGEVSEPVWGHVVLETGPGRRLCRHPGPAWSSRGPAGGRLARTSFPDRPQTYSKG